MMMDYSFGYDPEVPAGFQDADLEMAELEAAAYNYGDASEDYGGAFDGFTVTSDADSGL
jgi:hypothetical protein